MTEVWGRLWWKSTEIPVYQEWDDVTLFPGCRGEQMVTLDHKLNGYGGAQVYFLCPTCGERVRYLYFNRDKLFKCRKCSHLNYRSQQRTKGPDDGYNEGMKLAREKLGVLDRPCGADFAGYIPPRPRYMHESTYERYLNRFLKHRDRYNDRMYHEVLKMAGVLGELTKML